jgi:hypothetical protein
MFGPSTSFQAWSSKVPRHAKHKFLHLASNFQHQKLEAECKKIALAPLRTSKLGVSKLPQSLNEKISLGPFWRFQAPSFEAPRGANAKNFAFNIQLSTLKVGGRTQIFLPWPLLKLPSLDLESFKRGRGKFPYLS